MKIFTVAGWRDGMKNCGGRLVLFFLKRLDAGDHHDAQINCSEYFSLPDL